MAIKQDCWAEYQYKKEAAEWLRSLDIGDKLLCPGTAFDFSDTDSSGNNFEIVEIKSIHNTWDMLNGFVMVSYPNHSSRFDRKIPIKYAFAVRPIEEMKDIKSANHKKKELKQDNDDQEILIEKLRNESNEMKRLLNKEKKKRMLNDKKIKQEEMKLFAQINDYKKQNEHLIKQINKLKLKPLNIMDDRCKQQIDRLGLEELNTLQLRIQNAKQRLLENKLYCIICMEKEKNIVIQGCNHFVLCDHCHQTLQSKLCPICQTPFTNVIKLQT